MVTDNNRHKVMTITHKAIFLQSGVLKFVCPTYNSFLVCPIVHPDLSVCPFIHLFVLLHFVNATFLRSLVQ